MANLRKDDDIIDLRNEGDEAEFRIDNIEEEDSVAEVKGGTPFSEAAASAPYDRVKVKFDKFVNLVVMHASEELLERHADEDVVISTDLLADLANTHEEKSDGKKVPLIFLIGILLGIGITWLLLKL
ncbi:hypothetical protein A3B60_03455 [Candidatus Peregrinibacteria bacterium RIFCSPLOWO2_01_FULL_39_12]|nr:MAG: hypothetical protein A3B60_03455 [Candidatus Peregrinibacteria bacterium RIFCSPLOWO2_01_FULL_39_12]